MIKTVLFFIYSITQIYLTESKANVLNKIKLKGNYFVDNYGRVKLFHGANYIKRSYPWYPEELTNEKQLDNLKLWGFNSVRLGVMWSGLRPDINTVNTTYLNIILKMIDDLSDRGIYVIIDLHQDWMSSKFDSYDGFPLWLVDSMPNSTHLYPWPFKHKNLTLTSYLTNACGFAFQNLYSNVNKFQDYFLEYWTIVVNNVVNKTSVLAYEIINEPWSGDIYSDPNLLLPGYAGKNNLLPFYDNVYKTIRKLDQDTLVMYEPVIYGNILNGKFVGIGFDRAPANDSQRTILAWHYYCWLLFPINNTFPLFERIFCDDIQRDLSFSSIKKDIENIGGGSFLTEFGVCALCKEDGTCLTSECETILTSSDAYFVSWSYGDSNFYTINGSLNNAIIKLFSRVYPQSTSGIPISLQYDADNLIFKYSYEHNPSISQPTEIYIPEFLYKNGFQVRVSEHLKYDFDNNSHLLIAINDNWKEPFNATIVVQIVNL